jgi:hypothetical protein
MSMQLPISGRRIALAASLATVVLVAAGCGAPSTAPATAGGQPRAAQFKNTYLTFRYPATWRPLVFRRPQALHSSPMVYLSTQAGRPACSADCAWPVSQLHPDGVLVVWENRGYPGWTLRTIPGKPIRVDGRPARRNVSRPGVCAAIGGDETVVVSVARPLAYNWTQLTACLRGPRLATAEHELDGVLASTRFLAP